MKIAVVGAGLCGLSVTWHLIHKNPSLSITLFDPLNPKERTSSLANLLYPYIGIKSKRSWRGDLAFDKASNMIETLQQQSPFPFYSKKGLLKIPSNPSQLRDFEKATTLYDDLNTVTDPFFKKPALWINKALQVESDLYLETLCNSCIEKGVRYEKALFHEKDKENFDLIIYASGEKAKKFFKQTKCSLLKGQALILKRRKNLSVDFPIIYDGLHLIPSFDQKTVYVGNTFEREFDSLIPSKETAIELLFEKLLKLYPKVSRVDILEVKAGVRFNHANRLPKIGRLDTKEYLFTAMGSKGLLYHSFLAELLSNHILEGQTIPKEVLFSSSDRAY